MSARGVVHWLNLSVFDDCLLVFCIALRAPISLADAVLANAYVVVKEIPDSVPQRGRQCVPPKSRGRIPHLAIDLSKKACCGIAWTDHEYFTAVATMAPCGHELIESRAHTFRNGHQIHDGPFVEMHCPQTNHKHPVSHLPTPLAATC